MHIAAASEMHRAARGATEARVGAYRSPQMSTEPVRVPLRES